VSAPGAPVGIGLPAPVFAVRDLAVAMAFYARLGFGVRHHDAAYGYAEREALRIHLRASPELDPSTNHSEVYVQADDVDRLHAEWQDCGLLPVHHGIDQGIEDEARRRREAGEPVGLISATVEDKPWGVREFSLRDPDHNQLRFGRPSA
jgi:catechol 2,3-dioxygenase-like lactoylglutathione lyase family enzyme